MRYEVFHFEGSGDPEDRYRRFTEDAFARWPSADYVKVADVTARNLNDAYRLTNTIDHPWWENVGVELAPGLRGARSLSVGDILRSADGCVFGVASVGFTRLDGAAVGYDDAPDPD